MILVVFTDCLRVQLVSGREYLSPYHRSLYDSGLIQKWILSAVFLFSFLKLRNISFTSKFPNDHCSKLLPDDEWSSLLSHLAEAPGVVMYEDMEVWGGANDPPIGGPGQSIPAAAAILLWKYILGSAILGSGGMLGRLRPDRVVPTPDGPCPPTPLPTPHFALAECRTCVMLASFPCCFCCFRHLARRF